MFVATNRWKVVLTASVVVLGCAFVAPGAARAAPKTSDAQEIAQTALSFEESWYQADAERMKQLLHPAFVMRHVHDEASGRSVLDQDLTAAQLIALTGSGRGKVPLEKQQHDVTVLDVFQNAATAKIVSWYGVDYLQLVKWDGHWRVMSVVWGKNPPRDAGKAR